MREIKIFELNILMQINRPTIRSKNSSNSLLVKGRQPGRILYTQKDAKNYISTLEEKPEEPFSEPEDGEFLETGM